MNRLGITCEKCGSDDVRLEDPEVAFDARTARPKIFDMLYGLFKSHNASLAMSRGPDAPSGQKVAVCASCGNKELIMFN